MKQTGMELDTDRLTLSSTHLQVNGCLSQGLLWPCPFLHLLLLLSDLWQFLTLTIFTTLTVFTTLTIFTTLTVFTTFTIFTSLTVFISLSIFILNFNI